MFGTAHELTAAMAAGDTRAVEAFYRRYFDSLFSHARRFTGRDEAFCLDVVQEGVLRVIRSVRPARTESQFAAWLRLVIQTAAYDLIRAESRRHRREAVVSAGMVATTAASSLQEQSDHERLEWLRKEISLLDGEIVTMIEMRFEKRWTLARIAHSMGLTIGTVDGRLRRALGELRRRATEQRHD